jgi:tyrosine-protein phosphatase SIW14
VSAKIIKLKQVSDFLWRGGQPDKDGFLELSQLGIKTVVSLRWHTETIKSERELVREVGMNYVGIPLSYVILPTRKEIDSFLTIVKDAEKSPVFVHCKHGVDRTGMMVAFWRMSELGWSADRAYAEMENMGFHKIRMHHFKLAVYDFENRLMRHRRKNPRNV